MTGEFDPLLVHEYGHYVQHRTYGDFFTTLLGGVNSFLSEVFDDLGWFGIEHSNTWWERDATHKGFRYLASTGRINPDAIIPQHPLLPNVVNTSARRLYFREFSNNQQASFWDIFSLSLTFLWRY